MGERALFERISHYCLWDIFPGKDTHEGPWHNLTGQESKKLTSCPALFHCSTKWTEQLLLQGFWTSRAWVGHRAFSPTRLCLGDLVGLWSYAGSYSFTSIYLFVFSFLLCLELYMTEFLLPEKYPFVFFNFMFINLFFYLSYRFVF